MLEMHERFLGKLFKKAERLKVIFVDIVFGKDMRRTEEDLAAVDDLELAQSAGVELSIAWFEFAVDHRAHGVAEA